MCRAAYVPTWVLVLANAMRALLAAAFILVAATACTRRLVGASWIHALATSATRRVSSTHL